MTAKPSSRPCQPTAFRRRFRITIIALALSAIGLGASASPSLAATGSVYVDDNFNVGAGEIFFNATFTGVDNVGLGRVVMPEPDQRRQQRSHRGRRPERQHDRQLEHRDGLPGAARQHHRLQQRRHRHIGAKPEHHRERKRRQRPQRTGLQHNREQQRRDRSPGAGA